IYQGTIRKDSAIYTGQIDAVFRITNQDGSIEYWTSGSTTVYVNGGLFRYILGSPNEAQFNAIQWLNIDPYIETTVDGLTLPRDKLNTMPYAYHAKNAESSAGNFEVIDGDIKFSSATYSGGIIFSDGSYQITAAGTSLWVTSGADIYNVNTSNVGIGISNPSEKLEVAGNIKVSGGITAGSGNVNIIGIDGKIPALNSTYIANLDGSVLTNLTAANISGGNFANADYNFPGSITISTLTASSATLTNVSIFGALGSDLDADGYKIINLGAPSEDSDAANKIYVDNATGGGAGNVAILYATQTFTGQNTFIADVNISTNLFITSGNMGIGIINPSEKLEVLGNIKATAFQGSGSAITNLTAANISAGNLGSSVITSSIAVGAIDNESQIADGIITNADLAGSIADDKLSQIITTGKVSGAALTLLGSIASGAGFLPNANIDNSSITKLGAALEDAEIPDDITLTNITQITNRDISDTIGNLAVSRVTGGSLPSDVIASSIAVGAIDNENQIVDGTITNADLAGLIDDSKLNQIITAGKISDSALTTNVILSDNNQNITGIKTFTSSLTVISPDTVPSSLWVSTSATTPHLYVSTTGNVGIGTTGPGAALDVQGNPGQYMGIYKNTGTHTELKLDSSAANRVSNLGFYNNGVSKWIFSSRGTVDATNDRMAIYNSAGGAEVMTLLQNGNIGIGTTSPAYQLQVSGAGQTTANLTDAGASGGTLLLSDTGAVVDNGGALIFAANTNQRFAAIKGLFINSANNGQGSMAFSVRNLATDTSLTEAMRIRYDGNVGIGTTSPVATLHIGGTGAIKIPVGTTAERPASPAAGMMRFNSGTVSMEYYNGTAWLAATALPTAPVASGGTETTIIEGGITYRIHTFTTSGTLTVTAPGTVEVLVVAGGGSGGNNNTTNANGGGGGGGVIYKKNFAVTPQAYTVTVGNGGGAIPFQTIGRGNNGQNSVFSTLTALGGGGGASTGLTLAGLDGGSGGGGAHGPSPYAGGQAIQTGGYGNPGGRSYVAWTGGGGGGAGSAGVNTTIAPSGAPNGTGGRGLGVSITGSLVFYAGGGGGGANSSERAGDGYDGGGRGAGSTTYYNHLTYPGGVSPLGGNSLLSGLPNTGGGGGGGSYWTTAANTPQCPNCGSGAGGSGIVIVRYWISQ
ncbi:MAG: hypothetical protein L6420_00990, partial [Elusimicrobia bacterium]|nr:hypothetical protein [Elusimicrobiota bacterium]